METANGEMKDRELDERMTKREGWQRDRQQAGPRREEEKEEEKNVVVGQTEEKKEEVGAIF